MDRSDQRGHRQPVATATRRSLHAVAETLLAGPQWRRSGTIRLAVVPGGFGTIEESGAAVVGDRLVLRRDGRSFKLEGTLGQLAELAGLPFGAPEGAYPTGGALASDPVTVDNDWAAVIADAFAVGDRALRAFSDTADRTETAAPGTQDGAPVRPEPVLWPEHFDLAITLDAVNYGVSPGDDHIGEPYAYVGPWERKTGPFWDQPFGAARTLDTLTGEAGLVAFFQQGRTLAAS